MKLVSVIAASVIAVLAFAGCSSDDSSASAQSWTAYNRGRTGYVAKQNAVAKSVADRLNGGGLACTDFGEYPFDYIVKTYRAQGLPLALGAGACQADTDNVLIEVFGKSPSAADFVARKRAVICKKAKDLGRLPDGSSDFDGIPYVMSADRTWIVEPDSFKVNKQIAKILGRPARDMCQGIK